MREDCIPNIHNSGVWEIEVVRGPNDDWLDDNGYEIFLNAEWKLQARSDRTGFRLDGPTLLLMKKLQINLLNMGMNLPILLIKAIP